MMVERIHVLQLGGSLAVGGAVRMILSLSQELDRSRFAVGVCRLFQVEDEFSDKLAGIGTPSHVLGSRRFYSPLTITKLATLIRRHEIDIVHTHAVEADVAGTIAGRLTNRPVVTTLHSLPISYERRPLAPRTLHSIVIRHLSRNLVSVSKAAKSLFVRDWDIPASRMRTIYPAVDLEPFLRVPLGVAARAAQDRFQITNVGRLVPAKAQHLLIQAAGTVLGRFPNAEFVIVGPGPRRDELQHLARELGIAERVTLTGARDDVPEILARTDVFVLSSLWEGLPLSAVEAMAAARPVVLTDVGGCAELVENGVTGMIVPPGESATIAEAVNALLADAQRRVELGQAARERVRHAFAAARMAEEYEALYESIYSGSRRAHRRVRAELIQPRPQK